MGFEVEAAHHEVAAGQHDAQFPVAVGHGVLGALDARGGRYGLQTMCEGGGIANVTIIERLT